MDFIGGDPARTVKYHGFAPTPPQKFHRGISYHQGRKQQGAPPGMANVASGGTPPPTSFRSPKKNVGGGVYFTWSGEIFLRNFLPYPPPNIPGLKGGGFFNKVSYVYPL